MLFERLGDGDFLERKVAAILGVEQGVGGAVDWPGIQSVISTRTGWRPVMMLARVGLQTEPAA